MVSRVLKGIADTDYDVTKQLLLDEWNLDFDRVVAQMRKRATQLEIEADAEQTAKSRRFKKGAHEDAKDISQTSKDNNVGTSKQERIPFIPKYIINAIDSQDIKSD